MFTQTIKRSKCLKEEKQKKKSYPATELNGNLDLMAMSYLWRSTQRTKEGNKLAGGKTAQFSDLSMTVRSFKSER